MMRGKETRQIPDPAARNSVTLRACACMQPVGGSPAGPRLGCLSCEVTAIWKRSMATAAPLASNDVRVLHKRVRFSIPKCLSLPIGPQRVNDDTMRGGGGGGLKEVGTGSAIPVVFPS